MSRRRYRGRRQNRSGMFLVSTVVIVLMLMVSIKCVELKEKQDQYVVRQEELKQQIADEEARAEELEELKKYVQTDSYVEEIAEEEKTSAHHILTNFELPMLYTKIPKREKGV